MTVSFAPGNEVWSLSSVPCWSRETSRSVNFEKNPPPVPVMLKDYADHWPIARHALQSPGDVARYLMQFDSKEPLEALIADPREAGRLFYTQDLDAFNFTRMKGYLADALDILASQAGKQHPATFYVGSTSIPDYFPGLESECRLPGLSPGISPNIWFGNATLVATHCDVAENIACVASGRRRFTLFPPDQEENLYIGENPVTPGGRPISLVNLRDPDFDRFPRFAQALAQAQVAELSPGDALYMPKGWWHNVESFGSLAVLVNFWW